MVPELHHGWRFAQSLRAACIGASKEIRIVAPVMLNHATLDAVQSFHVNGNNPWEFRDTFYPLVSLCLNVMSC
jgi:hypothetical protein